MEVNNILNNLNEITQSIVMFLFASKWSLWILGLIVILYLIWKGMEKAEKKEKITSALLP